jgi:hypothetical protein
MTRDESGRFRCVVASGGREFTLSAAAPIGLRFDEECK